MVIFMMGTPRSKLTVTSSLNEISRDQMGKRGRGGEEVDGEPILSSPPPLFMYSRLLNRYQKTT
jgi:hypothetical protein